MSLAASHFYMEKSVMSFPHHTTPCGQCNGKAAVIAPKLRSIYGDQCFEIANSPCWPQTLVVVIPKRGESNGHFEKASAPKAKSPLIECKNVSQSSHPICCHLTFKNLHALQKLLLSQ